MTLFNEDTHGSVLKQRLSAHPSNQKHLRFCSTHQIFYLASRSVLLTTLVHAFTTRYIYTTITKAESVISPKSHPMAKESVSRPVLTLSALELAVERAAAGPTSCRRGRGVDLTIQSQVNGGADSTLLQIHTLRAPLVTQIRRHEQRAGK